MLKINKEKCIKCKTCIYVCPSTAIGQKNEEIVMVNPEYCIRCMHCACICPAGAISSEQAAAYDNDAVAAHGITKQELTEFIKSCRSIRNYKNEIVSKEEIEQVITALSWSASAKNEHTIKTIVVSGKQNADKIFDMVVDYVDKEKIFPEILRQRDKGNNIVIGNSINLMFFCGDSNANNPGADAIIAASNARLIFETMEIGSCYSGYLMSVADNIPEMAEFLKVPEGNKIYEVLIFGYKGRETYNRIPYRKKMETIWIE